MSRGLNSLDKSQCHKSFWADISLWFLKSWLRGNVLKLPRDLLVYLRGSVRQTLNLHKGLFSHCVFWSFDLSEVLPKCCTVMPVLYAINSAVISKYKHLLSSKKGWAFSKSFFPHSLCLVMLPQFIPLFSYFTVSIRKKNRQHLSFTWKCL